MCIKIGLLFIFTMGFGTFFVYSGNLVPNPPAKITIFITTFPIKIKFFTIVTFPYHFFFVICGISRQLAIILSSSLMFLNPFQILGGIVIKKYSFGEEQILDIFLS